VPAGGEVARIVGEPIAETHPIDPGGCAYIGPNSAWSLIPTGVRDRNAFFYAFEGNGTPQRIAGFPKGVEAWGIAHTDGGVTIHFYLAGSKAMGTCTGSGFQSYPTPETVVKLCRHYSARLKSSLR
jgi:hypothetical protein